MNADHEVVVEITKSQFWAGLGGAGVIGGAIIKVADKLWARITARNDNLQEELISLIKTTNESQLKLTEALVELRATIREELRDISKAMPKREGDVHV